MSNFHCRLCTRKTSKEGLRYGYCFRCYPGRCHTCLNVMEPEDVITAERLQVKNICGACIAQTFTEKQKEKTAS